MSVVNKMLQDLEARKSQTDEINSDYQPPPKKSWKWLILVLLILAIAAIIFALEDINQLFAETEKTDVATSVNVQPLTPKSTKKMAVAQKNVSQQPVQSPKISVQHAQSVDKKVATATNSVVLDNVFADEQIQPNVPKMATDSLIALQNIDTLDKQLDKQVATPSDIELTPQLIAEPTFSFSMNSSSQENNSSSLKQRIAESLNNEDLDLAQSLLKELLAAEPNNIKARKKLASLLFAQGNYAQSKQLLIQGIKLHPVQSDVRLMLARLYVVQKEPSQALNLLTEFYPSVNNQTEYLAYRAALAQQLKQTQLAKSDYQALTNIESTNAKWWLGLALARDQLGETNKALQAYNKAHSLNQLNSAVNDFMQQRISVLAGAQ
jgi:MSHA biogenesis protein MshN